MKIKHLLIGMLAIAGAVACNQVEPVEEPKLEVDKATVEVAATAGEASFNVTSNQSWVAIADADWVSLEPASGEASEKAVAVKVTAEDNETTAAREATVTVKAGDLTKTVKVTQVAAGETPGPQPGQSEWALVGSFNEWNAESDLYLSVLDDEYFVYYGFELAANDEFKFLKGGAWPPAGTEVGGNGLVEPNTIQPAGGSNIKVTEAGKYDIYLAADLTKFYIMSEGKLPSEAVEPAPVENQWSMMGCFVDNQWSTDVPMTKEGEWIVAKGAQFTELTFKIRANASWADATNIGRAPGSERAVVNGKIEVVTAEYSKANLGGDAADIKLNGEPGTYDVYFSFENLEVYVMEEGFKPGEKEPQNPAPVEITYTVAGTIADNVWSNNAEIALMAKEGDLYVAKNVPFVWNSTCYGGDYNIIEFKIVETGTWDVFAYPEKNVNQYANAEITVQIGGENIALNAPEGSYDVYFDKANLKVWVMEAGFKPGEKEPLIPEETEPVTEGVIWENDGTVGAAAWSGSPYRFSIEGGDSQNECVAEIPAAVWAGMKTAPFNVEVKYGPEATWWQIRVLDGWWTVNDASGDSDVTPQTAGVVDNGNGTYTFQVDLSANAALLEAMDTKHLLFAGDGFIINKIYFGDLPTPGEPEQPELQKSTWALVGSFNGWDAAASTAFLSVLDANYFVYYGFEAGANTEFKFVKDGKWANQGGAEIGGAIGTAEPNTIQPAGGKNIVIAEAGKYDIYLAADLSKFYVMTEGKLPAEATEPAPVETTYTVVGTLNGINWSNNAPEGLMKKEGAYYVAKNVPFVTAKTLYGGADQFEFKVVETGTWNGYGVAAGTAAAPANTEIALQETGENIPVTAAEGAYDVYFDKENAKVWVMTPGLKPGETPAPEPEYTLDGKQWLLNAMGTYVLVDLGLYEEDAMVIALPAMDGSGFACYMYGAYEIEKTDAKSGNIIFTQYDVEFDEFMDPVAYPYSELSESVVYVSMENVLGDPTPLPFVAIEEPYEIMFEEVGGADPVGEIENGDYWFIEPTTQKVMTPLAETQTYGRPTAADAVGGASTAKNAFTFTYNPDWSCYTIQDSYGRYLYSSMQSDGETPYRTLSVADSTPADDDENLAFYMWTVYNNGDGTYDVYNCATYYSISYSASYNNWEIYDPYEDDFNNLFAALVKADNPVAEPEPEPEPEPSDEVLTLTNAEICAALTSSSTSYATYTIESASGLWTVNASQLNTNTFLQCRGKKGGYIKTPEYDKDIKSVTIHFTSAKSVYSNNTYCVFPSTWTAPTADAAYPETGNVGKAVTDGSYSLTIPVEAGNKQVYISIIGTYSYYLDHIDVAF